MAERERRRREAAARQALRGARSDRDQLSKLENNGHGHCKEAEKLRESVAAKTAVTYVLKVNGQKVDTFQAMANATEDELREMARTHPIVKPVKDERIRSIVVVLGKSVNVKG